MTVSDQQLPSTTSEVPGPLVPGSTVVIDGPSRLHLAVERFIGSRGTRRYFLAYDEHATAYTLVEQAGLLTPPILAPLRGPDERIVRHDHELINAEGGALRVYRRPAGNTVSEWLTDSTAPDPVDVLLFGVSLCEAVESLHGGGRVVLSLDPEHVMRTGDLEAAIIGLEELPRPGELPRQLVAATAAPEVVHRVAPLCGITSDVYTVATILHALLARRPLWSPPAGMSPVLVHAISPRVWRPDLPLGIWPRLAPALDPDPGRRTPHLSALRTSLLRALHAIERRRSGGPRIALDGWADSHIGVGKGRRGGDQQDRLFCGIGPQGASALVAVADGVSHATLGDGGTAAEHTIRAVQTLFDELSGGEGPATSGPHEARTLRERRLTAVLDAATFAIAQDANDNYPALAGDPSGVMASTLVAGLADESAFTVLNVGDSRAYLFDGEVCEAITIDHDRRTEAVRMGMDPYSAAGLDSGGALTRAVGRTVVGPDRKLQASPSPADCLDVTLLPGDRVVLCSDGLPDYCTPPGRPLLSPTGVEEALLPHIRAARDPSEAAHALIGLANRNGGHDNIAVVVLFVSHAPD